MALCRLTLRTDFSDGHWFVRTSTDSFLPSHTAWPLLSLTASQSLHRSQLRTLALMAGSRPATSWEANTVCPRLSASACLVKPCERAPAGPECATATQHHQLHPALPQHHHRHIDNSSTDCVACHTFPASNHSSIHSHTSPHTTCPSCTYIRTVATSTQELLGPWPASHPLHTRSHSLPGRQWLPCCHCGDLSATTQAGLGLGLWLESMELSHSLLLKKKQVVYP